MREAVATVVLMAMFGMGGPSAQNGEKSAGVQVCTLKVSGMVCHLCSTRVEKTARKIAGVKSATADQLKGLAEITYDPAKATPESIAKAIGDKTGFKTEVAPKTSK